MTDKTQSSLLIASYRNSVQSMRHAFHRTSLETTFWDRLILGMSILISLVFAVSPLYIMVVTSLSPAPELYSLPPELIPSDPTLEHYERVLFSGELPFIQNMINSFIVATVTASVSVALATFGAYSFARLDFPGRETISRGVLVVYMFGGILLVVPLYQVIIWLHLIDTLYSLIITYIVFGLPLSLWLLGSYFEGIPEEIEEAALMDGYSRLEVIFRITLPMSTPALIAVYLYTFLIGWNEYLFASVFLQSDGLFTLPILIENIHSTQLLNIIWPNLMAATTLATIPVFVMFFYLEKFLTDVSFGLKG